MAQIKQMTVGELKARLDKKENFVLVDVREKDEYNIGHIEGSKLIPLSQFADKALLELKPDQDIVIHCHHGGRSQRACEFLAGQGFATLANVSGGIHAWSVEIDPDVPQY